MVDQQQPLFTRYRLDDGRLEFGAVNCIGIKGQLKARRWRWDPGRRVWWKRPELGYERDVAEWIKENGWTLSDGGQAPFGLS